uniref:CCHC-type domain-containing protein n=1 Tax=Magallana gigas TaxID=29159 RepID=A0A8W8LH45_MAGGI
MSELPSWVNDQIKKGASLSDCLEMLKLLSEKDREERKIEREERQAEREMKKAALDHEFKVKELALKEEELKVARANGGKLNGSSSVQNSHVKLPKLEEGQDIDVFLRSFEKLAALHKWDKSEWAIHLVPLLTGKALEAYSRLSDGESGKYDKIKEAILKRYELTSEAYREKFRQARQQSDESFKDYQVRTEKYLSHWCEREDIHGQYNSLYDLVLREQLLKFCDKDLQVWVHEHRPKNVKEVIDLVEAYQTAHKRLTFGGNRKNGTDRNSQGNFNVNQGQFKAEQGKGPQVKDRACYYCKRPGHIQRDCSLYNRGQYRKPEDKKFGKLGLCLSEHENKQHTEGGKPDLYTSAALVKLPGVSTGDTKDVDDNSVPGLDISRGSVGDSPFADVILGNVIDKIEKMEVEKPADCLAVQTRAQTRLEAEETKPRPKKTDDAIDILGGVYESMDYDSEFNDRASPSLELQKGAEDVIFSNTLSNTQRHVVVTKIGKFSLLCSFPNVCHHFQGDDGLYQLNCDYKVGDEYGAPDPPFSIHIGDTWRRCTCMVYGDRERSTLETLVYVCCVVVS